MVPPELDLLPDLGFVLECFDEIWEILLFVWRTNIHQLQSKGELGQRSKDEDILGVRLTLATSLFCPFPEELLEFLPPLPRPPPLPLDRPGILELYLS